MRYLASIALICICVGCSTTRPVVSAEVDRAVETSSSFRRAQTIDRSRVIWLSEGTDEHYTLVYVGFDMGTHTCRSATLRVSEHGIVERQEMTKDGDLIWIADN